METEKPVVLLVDDDEAVAKLARAKFEWLSFPFFWVKTVADAKKFISETPGYIVVFVDIKLKGETGLSLFQWIQEKESHRVVSFGFTSERSALVEMKALQSGAITFFFKDEKGVYDRILNYATLSLVLDRIKKSEEDELTQLLNYPGFKRIVVPEMVVARDRPDHHHSEVFTLLVIELLSFKECRDYHGYLAGNSMILAFVEFLKKNVRPTDHICRNGEDEFMIWLPGVDKSQSREISAKIREQVSLKPVVNGGGNTVPFRFSIGTSQVRRAEVGRDAEHKFEELVAWARRDRK